MLRVKRPLSTIAGNDAGLLSDECASKTQEQQSIEPGHYMLSNFYNGCNLDQQFGISLLERGNIIKNGYGPQGCNIDADSTLRFEDNTNLKMLHTLNPRPHLTIPFMGRGSAEAGIENVLRCGFQTTSHKACNTLADKSIDLDRMVYKLHASPQKVEHIVDPYPRGGRLTRNDVRQARAIYCSNHQPQW